MNYEYYYEYFMNTFMNTFLREMKQMKAFKVYTPFYVIKKDTYDSIRSIERVCVHPQSIHLFHSLRESIHKSLHKVFINFSFLEVW